MAMLSWEYHVIPSPAPGASPGTWQCLKQLFLITSLRQSCLVRGSDAWAPCRLAPCLVTESWDLL